MLHCRITYSNVVWTFKAADGQSGQVKEGGLGIEMILHLEEVSSWQEIAANWTGYQHGDDNSLVGTLRDEPGHQEADQAPEHAHHDERHGEAGIRHDCCKRYQPLPRHLTLVPPGSVNLIPSIFKFLFSSFFFPPSFLILFSCAQKRIFTYLLLKMF